MAPQTVYEQPTMDWKTKEFFEKHYYQGGKSFQDIAQEVGVSKRYVGMVAKSLGIQVRSNAEAHTVAYSWDDYATLYQDHHINKLNIAQIARKYGVALNTIKKRMRTHKIPILQEKDNFRLPRSTWDSKEWLEEQYINNKLSIPQIAKLIGCSKNCARDALVQHGVELRSTSDAVRLRSDLLSEQSKARWTPEFTAKMKPIQSANTKRLWENIQYRQKILSRRIPKSKSKPVKNRVLKPKIIRVPKPKADKHLISKKQWQDPKYREKTLRRIREVTSTKEWAEGCTLRTKQSWLRPSTKVNYLAGVRKAAITCNTPEHRAKMSATSKRLWEDPAYREKIAKGKITRLNDIDWDSLPEKIIKSLLIDFGYLPRKIALGRWTFDWYFEVGTRKILIECQGVFTHSSLQAVNRDIIKYQYLTENHPEYEIYYIDELQLYSPGLLRNTILRIINKDVEIQDIPFKDLIIQEIDKDAGIEFLAKYHYLNPSRNGIWLGATYQDNLVSVAVLSPVTRIQSTDDLTSTLEISRFCINPRFQKKNLASWFLNRCRVHIKNNYPKITTLISFADSAIHNGTIYLAAGFTKCNNHYSSYHYLDGNGNYYHKKTIYNWARNQRQTEAEFANSHGLTRIDGKPILKFTRVI